MKKKVLVIGETCDDIFIYGDIDRLSPEAPIPIIKPQYEVRNKGMAENVVKNLESLGVEVDFISNSEKIEKIRYVDDSHNYILLRVDFDHLIKPINLELLPNDNYDAVVIADYNKGFINNEVIKTISKKYTCPKFLDTKKEISDWVNDVDTIKINYSEYKKSKEFIDSNPVIKNKTIITRGKFGCDFQGKTFPTQEVEIKDVAGAGDTFLAGLVFKYLDTNSLDEAIIFANLCSTQVVQKRGVSIVNKNELYV